MDNLICFLTFYFMVLKDQPLTDEVVGHHNEDLGDEGLDAVDPYQIMVDKLADDLGEFLHQDVGQGQIQGKG